MSSIRERLLGNSSNNTSNNSTIRTRLGIADDYKKNTSVNNSTIDINSYRARKKELENQIANYDREEKVKWWDKENNVIENIGNVFYKALIEQQDNKYVEDENYNKLLEEYKNIDKKIDDYIVNNKTYSNNIYGTADKFVDVASGSLTTSAKGVDSTMKKLLWQTPKVETTLQEKLSNKALSESKGVEKVALDLWGNMVRMTPQMFTGSPNISLALSFANYGGSAYNQAKEEGYSEKQATMYGATIGTLETALTKLLGGFEKVYGKSVAGNATQKIMKKIISNPSLRKYITSVSGEFTEEYLQEFLDPIVRNVILEEENGADFWNASNLGEGIKQLSKNLFNKENLYAGALGALSSGIVDSPYLVDAYNSRNNTNNVNAEIAKSSINMPTVNDIVKQENGTNNVILPPVNDFAKNSNKINYTGDSNMSFAEQVDKWKSGNFNKNSHLVVFKETPKIYQDIGIDNLPVTIVANKLERVYNSNGKSKGRYHGLGEVVKQLPDALANPLNIVESTTDSNSIVVVTRLGDMNENIVVVSIKPNGNGQMEIDNISKNQSANVLTSVYGRENYDYQSKPVNNSYKGWMQLNKENNRIIYDIDDGIKKQRVNGQWVESPNSNNSFVANNIPQFNQNVKSGILPVTNNMQSSENNAINMPTIEKHTKPSKKSKQIAKILNETIKNDALEVKQRKWIETSLESEIVKDKVLLEDLDFNKISYVVQSNKKTLDKANNKLDSMGYDTSVKYIQSKINDNDISLTDIALAERLIQEAINKGDTQLASDLLMDTAILGTDLGQKVQALSMIQRLTPEGQLRFYQKLVKRAKAKGDTSFKNVEITPEMVDLILNAYKDDGTFEQNDLNSRVEQFKEKVAEQLITTKSEKIVAWRYLSMLGNPKTHIRNMVSNVAMWGTQKVKNAVARTIETVVPIENRTKTWKKASQEVSDYAKKTTEEMREIITGESKYNEKASIERKKQTFKSKTLEKIKDFNSNLLSKEDWIFSKTAFENSLKEYLTAQNIITNEDIANNSEIIEKAKLYAIKEAEKATFRQYSWLASQISKIENKNALTKIVVGSTIPFKKTPINIAKTGASYSPLGLIKTISYDAYQVSKGNMEASQFIDNLSQGLTGTSLTLIGYALAKAGILKGAGDDDKEGKYDSYLGNQTYSIRIGDSTYSISWLSPVAMPLLVGATAYEKLEKQAEWDMNVVVDTLAQTLDPLSEMSFLSSLDDVLSSYDSGIKKFAGMAGSMGQNYLTQFIPTLFSQIASTLDDKKRTTRASNNSTWKFGEETVRKVMYKVPILRNQLEASTDIWGNEIKQSDNIIERAFENFIAPYSRKEDISTSLDEELKRLYNSTGETSVIPGVPKAYVKYKDVTYQMSAKEYTKYKKTYGNTANTYLTKLVENENYINATDEQKASMIKEVYSYASALANEEYFSEKDVEYENDSLKEINKIKELKMTNTQIAEYVAQKKIISSIKSDEQLTASEKKKEISEYLINAKLNDKQLAYLYDKYYSSEKVLDNLLNANIPIKEFIKFNSQEFTTDYYGNGKAITNSRKLKVINYINSLNLSVPQKAILIKMEYSSYDSYDNQIIKYINNLDYSKFEKASLLKSFGFSAYDKYLIDYVNNMNISKEEKSKMLEDMGFTIRNGKVYSK